MVGLLSFMRNLKSYAKCVESMHGITNRISRLKLDISTPWPSDLIACIIGQFDSNKNLEDRYVHLNYARNSHQEATSMIYLWQKDILQYKNLIKIMQNQLLHDTSWSLFIRWIILLFEKKIFFFHKTYLRWTSFLGQLREYRLNCPINIFKLSSNSRNSLYIRLNFFVYVCGGGDNL